MSDTEFCFRACIGPSATVNCNHIYDVMGCYWVRWLSLAHVKFQDPIPISPRTCLPTTTPVYLRTVMPTTSAYSNLPSPSWLNLCFLYSLPMGVYGTSTWYQGVSPTPPAHPAASSSNCQALPSDTVSPANAKLSRRGFEKRFVARFPEATQPPARRWD